MAEKQVEALKAQLEEAQDDKHHAEKMYQLLDIVKLKPMKEAISYVCACRVEHPICGVARP